MICIDSDCIIDFLKGKKEAINIINKYKEEIVSTEINAFEVFYGIYNKKIISEKESAKNLFNSIILLGFEKGCGEQSAKIIAALQKQGNLIEQNDCIIAGILIKNNCLNIITKNIKHYERIKGLNVISY